MSANPFLDAIQGNGATPTTTTLTPPTTTGSSNPFLDAINSTPNGNSAPIKTSTDTSSTVNGRTVLPAGFNGPAAPGQLVTKTLPAWLGGGAYIQDPENPTALVTGGHTTYANEPAIKGSERDDIIPVALGGANNSPLNLQYQPGVPTTKTTGGIGLAGQSDNLEAQVYSDYKSGKISLDQARVAIETGKYDLTQNNQPWWEKAFNTASNIADNISQGANKVAGTLANALITGTTSVEKALQVPAGLISGQSVKQAYKSAPTLGGYTGQFVATLLGSSANIAEQKLIANKGNDLKDALIASLPDISSKIIDQLAVPAVISSALGGEFLTENKSLTVTPDQIQTALDNPNLKWSSEARTNLETLKTQGGFKIQGTAETSSLLKQIIGKYILGGSVESNLSFSTGESPVGFLPESAPEGSPNAVGLLNENHPANFALNSPVTTPSIPEITNPVGFATVAGHNLTMPNSEVPTEVASNTNHPLNFANTPNVPKTGNLTPIENLISHEGAPDTAQVEKYKQMIQSGKPIEPLKIISEGQGKFGVDDGKHRLEAYKQLGYTQVPTEDISKDSKTIANYLNQLALEYPSGNNFAAVVNRKYGMDWQDAVDLWNKAKSSSEAGFIDPTKIGNDVAKSIKDAQSFIKETQRMTDITGEVKDELYNLKNQQKVDQLVASKYLQGLKEQGITAKDAEAIYHYKEDPNSVNLTPAQEAAMKGFAPIEKEALQAYKRINELTNVPDAGLEEGYVHRIAQNKGGMFDKLMEQTKSRIGGRSVIKKSAPSLKSRRYVALEDGNGNRTVGFIKNGRVTEFVKNQAKDLGQYKVKSNEQLLEQDIKPIQKQLDRLQKELDGIKSIKVSDPVSETIVKNVTVELEKILATIKTLDKDSGLALDAQNFKANSLIGELRGFEKMKTGESLSNVNSRIQSIQKKMLELSNQMSDIERQYNPNELTNRKFVAKGGKEYTIKQATTKEIEANTSTRYYKNYFANTIQNYINLVQAERAITAMDNLLQTGEAENFAMKADQGNPPKGWKMTTAIRGYWFAPRIATAIDQILGHTTSEGLAAAFGKVNLVLRDAVVLNPIPHTLNIGTQAFINRGVSRLLNPRAYGRGYQSLIRAVKAAYYQNDDYIVMMKQGAPIGMFGKGAQEYYDGLLNILKEEVEKTPTENLKALFKKYNWNQIKHSSSFIQDVLTMQRIYELQSEGVELKTAMKEVSKDIPDYKLPANWVGNFLRGHNVALFGSYDYGLVKSAGNIMKDLFEGSAKMRKISLNGDNSEFKEGAKQAGGALDKIVAAMVILWLAKQVGDKLVQKATKNKNAHITIPGLPGLVMHIYEMAKGNETPEAFLLSRTAIGTREFAEQAFNSDFRLNQKITPYTINQGQAWKDRINHIIQAIPQVGQFNSISQGSLDLKSYLRGLFGIYTPKNNSSTTSFNTLVAQKQSIQSRVKALIQSGDNAGAQNQIDIYNKALEDKAKEAGISNISSQEMKFPKQATIDKYMQEKAGTYVKSAPKTRSSRSNSRTTTR